MEKKMYKVKNRSASTVGYNIPDMNIKRFFNINETKLISFDELQQLSYQMGGKALLREVLQVENADVVSDLDMKVEPEYWMNEDKIKELILDVTKQDEFLDCLDFAPEGVIDLIKDLSIKLPMTDLNKIKALKNKTGFDVQLAIVNTRDENDTPVETVSKRRVKSEEDKKETSGRRVPSEYKVVNKED